MSYETKRLERHSVFIAVLVGMALAVSACGPDHNSRPRPRAVLPVATPTPTPAPPPTACLPSSSLSVLVQGSNVLSYIPKGAWDLGTTGVSLIQVEGTGVTPGVIKTSNAVNSCSSNSTTGQTVCTANNTDVYLISGLTLLKKLTSSGSGTISFTGGSCTNCGVAFNAATNQAVIGLAISSNVGGFQFLDLGGAAPAFEKAFKSKSPTGEVSEDIAVDPTRQLLLSPNESATYEVLNIATSTSPKFFENDLSSTALGGTYDSAAEDCATGVALSTDEFTGNLYLGDLNQATFTPGSPAGTWTAPQQLQHFP